MTDFQFDSRTARCQLPMLFAGQAQKEVFFNEAIARIDALLHLAIEAEASGPPAEPRDGQNWLVAVGATGEWAGHDGEIAMRQSGNWLFAAPCAGMRLTNLQTGQESRYLDAWHAPARPVLPAGGTTIDTEARTALAAILSVLTESGIIPPSPA